MHHNWSGGYVADMTYSHGYYHELAPSFIRFFLLMNGYANASQGGSYNYCELGYGQGVSCNLHAAANPRGRFAGTDFNPEHALFAQALAGQGGLRPEQADWRALGFPDMLEVELPQFDFVTLHGVWSWIDGAARHALVEFLRRRLKLGGVVYLSYNVMPGWSAEKPLRDLLWLHTRQVGSRGAGTAARIEGALAFADALRKGKASFFNANPPASQMLDDMLRDDRHVVAHEYFNEAWHLTYFADVAEALDAANLSFACSLHRSDLTGDVFQRTQALGLNRLPTALRQTANDFVLNRRFRRDVFVRGAARMDASQRDAALREVSLVLQRPASAIVPALQTPYGTVSLDAAITRQIARVMAEISRPISIGELIAQADLHSVQLERVFEVLAALVAQSQLAPVFTDDAACAGDARCETMNRHVAARARHDDVLRYLASPVTGQAVEASRTDRLLLLAWTLGARSPEALAALAMREAGDAAAECAARAEEFTASIVPLWRRLGILAEGSAA
ncbi:class I SAM-dependent methyltransferase [Ramlibacter sp. AN1015]|uniref:class I SAM-dependent methyltransferase n=1 Tax=Ramlibacter sp. AN1015 TaxID=3133428 RepID=UPI0030C236A9